MSKIDYIIPKIEVKVDILIDDEPNPRVDEYILFLSQFSRYRKGSETIYEFLNKQKENEFIPLKNCSTGEFFLLKLDNIVFVKEKERYSHQSLPEIVFTLRNNIRLEVTQINSLPDSKSRILDYLNQEALFIMFYHDDRKIFVNKNKIIRVKEQ